MGIATAVKDNFRADHLREFGEDDGPSGVDDDVGRLSNRVIGR